MRSKQTTPTGGLVYSTEQGKMCPTCSRALADCICKQQTPSAASKDGFIRVGRETAGRKGSGVTVIQGLGMAPEQLNDLCTLLKKRCGSGGTVKAGVIEIQGDHRDTLVAELTKKGYRVKRVGG